MKKVKGSGVDWLFAFIPNDEKRAQILEEFKNNSKMYKHIGDDEAAFYWFLDRLGLLNTKNVKMKAFMEYLVRERNSVQGMKHLQYYLKHRKIPDIEDLEKYSNRKITTMKSVKELRGVMGDILPRPPKGDVESILKNLRTVDISNPEFFDDRVDFMVKQLWMRCFKKKTRKGQNTEAVKVKFIGKKAKFHNAVVKNFRDEYRSVRELEGTIPKSYAFGEPPKLMQLYIAYKMSEMNGFFNMSGTGSGKTLSAILASRLCKAKMTFVVCPKPVLDQWEEQIITAFPDVEVSRIGKGGRLEGVINKNKPNFILVNYDKLSIRTYNDNIRSIAIKNKVDFVILDETQLVKIRGADDEESDLPDDVHVSERRRMVNEILAELRRKHYMVRVLCLSATPIINNVHEGKSLLEIVSGEKHPEIGNRVNIRNAAYLHMYLSKYSIRYIEDLGEKVWTGTKKNIKDVFVNAKIPSGVSSTKIRQSNWLYFEQLATKARIPAMLKIIKPNKKPVKTVIYTEYVQHWRKRTSV